MQSRSFLTTLGSISAILIASTLVPSAEAGEPVSIGEVTSEVVRAGIDVEAVMRNELTREMLRLRVNAKKMRAVLSVSLVRLDTTSTAEGMIDTCKIIATLRDAKGGAIFAILEGGAHGSHDAQSKENMVRAAVKGLVFRIPEAFRSSK
jgi:hypothetical protein